MYFRKKTSGGRTYLQIVESRREGAAVLDQRASLGLRGDARLQTALGRGTSSSKTKSLLETRPIYHKLNETIRDHVACRSLRSF